MSKNILLISHSLQITGAPLSLFGIAKILKESGCNVSVLSLKDGVLTKTYKEKLNIEVKILNKNIKENVQSLKEYLSNFDFVIINTVVCDFFADICENINIPYVWIIRESQNIKVFVKNWKYTYKCLKKCQKNIYVVSEYAQNYIKTALGIDVNILHNFVEDESTNNQLCTDSLPVNFSFLGTIEKRKGVDVLIDAICKLDNNHKNLFNLNIIGAYTKGYTNYSQSLLNKTESYPNVHWCGVLTGEAKQKIFAQTDVFIVPSIDEASSRVVLEACMMGRPVIVTENVGAKYMINSNTGWIVKTGDAEDLKKCIENILANPQILPEMGKAARKIYLKTSTPEIYKEKLEKIINSIISQKTNNIINRKFFNIFSVYYLNTYKLTYFLGIKIKQKYPTSTKKK